MECGASGYTDSVFLQEVVIGVKRVLLVCRAHIFYEIHSEHHRHSTGASLNPWEGLGGILVITWAYFSLLSM